MVQILFSISKDPATGLPLLIKGFYEWLKQELGQTCPDEQTLPLMLRDIRNERAK